MANIKPILLIILDGWGYSEKIDGNAILGANTPTWDKLWAEYPHTLISGSGKEVGLPSGQMGNSEVGHLNLGAGRAVYQEYTRISNAIADGTFYTNKTLTDTVDQAVAKNKAVHIIGLLSPGGVHSHEEQIHAIAELAAQRNANKLYLHAFLDGRDTAPKSAAQSIEKMEAVFSKIGCGRFASVIGRYFAMDRDHRWPRIKKSYELITEGKGEYQSDSALEALNIAYERGETDEFVSATAIRDINGQHVTVEDGDAVIFANYRSDRARQITRAFIEDDFEGFERISHPKLSVFCSLTEYNKDFNTAVAYPAQRLNNVFGEYIAQKGMRQLRIAETEKYAHVTFFFNGGREEPFIGEDRVLVPSPNVATYDLQPEMSSTLLTDKLIEAIESDKYDAIICNYANPDMVGHTGNYDTTVKAIEALDHCLNRLYSVIRKNNGEMLITADHGNAEQMYAEFGNQAHTAHTNNPVPFVYVGRKATCAKKGSLADVAPTMLRLMGLEIPSEMNGHPLVKLDENPS